MGEQLKGEATADLQDDSTFVLKPVNPFPERLYMGYGEVSEEWKLFEANNPPIPTTNTNLKEGELVQLADYEEVEQYLDTWTLRWTDGIDVYKQMRTVLVLKEKKLSPLSDEQPSDHIPQSGKMVQPIAEGEELSEDEKWILMVRFVKWYGNNAVDSKYMKDILKGYKIIKTVQPT